MKQQLNELFDYKDGQLIWKISTAKCIKIGDIAGSICKTNGYRVIRINKILYKAHRLIWIYFNGDIDTALQIDHINQIRSDNRIENLRLATRSQNGSNRPKQKDNTSGYKGVSWSKQHKKWVAQIIKNKKLIYLGLFATPEVASQAYNAAATKLQGEFACWE